MIFIPKFFLYQQLFVGLMLVAGIKLCVKLTVPGLYKVETCHKWFQKHNDLIYLKKKWKRNYLVAKLTNKQITRAVT